MITTSHGILAYWFNRYLNHRLKTRVHTLFIILGSTMPDFFHVANAIMGWISLNFLNAAWHSELLINISKFLHSFPIFAITFTLSFFLVFLVRHGFYYGRTVSFFCGWGFFHIVLDIFTHRGKSWPYFWPWTDIPIHGFIDHFDPVLILIEIIIIIVSLAYFLSKKFRPRP